MRQEELSAKQKVLNSFAQFIQNNRILLIAAIVVVFVGIAGFSIYAIWDISRTKSLLEYSERAEEILVDYSKPETDEAEKNLLEEELLGLKETVAESKKSSYAYLRVLLILETIYMENEEWEKALAIIEELETQFADAYVAARVQYDKASAKEYLGDIDESLAILLSIHGDFMETEPALAARALFNAGRIEESRGNNEAAIEHYETVISEYDDSSWTNLATQRIIILENRN
jgi:predicted negative regulator of RcsB-dependent stress response